MSFAVVVEPVNGNFVASLVGSEALRAVGKTREQALESLRATITDQVAQGKLLAMEIKPAGVSSLAGKYADDPTLRGICRAAYRQRDAEGGR